MENNEISSSKSSIEPAIKEGRGAHRGQRIAAKFKNHIGDAAGWDINKRLHDLEVSWPDGE